MRKIYFKYSTGYCGMDSAEVAEFPDNVTEEELNTYAYEGALNNAEAYGIYPTQDYFVDNDEEDDDGGDSYSDNIEGYWEEYNPEEHDGTY
jgi:predicted PolB exonuclease-like 3'-5' exonuclease